MKEKNKQQKTNEVISRINESIANLKNKNFSIYFFVIDTKGTPNGSIQYIYEMGKELIDLGYKVTMLHQEKEYNGVSEWLGEEYDSIPHASIECENIKVSTSDFLIIPEIFSNVMNQTKDLPLKRIILCQNINYITEFIPLGVSWTNYNISDIITTSQTQANELKTLFPSININVINPAIPDYFRNDDVPKKLMVSVITREQTLINKIIKQFHWKYPNLRWVTFTDLRNMPRKLFSDTLRESAFTIWVDDETYFGYAPIEAIKSGSIVIGKIPDIIPEWMFNEDNSGLSNAGVWFNDLRDVQKITSNAINSFLDDDIPEELYDSMKTFENKYTMEQRRNQIIETFDKFIEDRIQQITKVKDNIEKGINKDNKD